MESRMNRQVSLNGKEIKDWKLLSEKFSPLELEIETTKLLKLGFERRGFTVIHHGKMLKTSPSGKPDIIVFNDNFHINFEVTKTTKTQADREFNSIKTHLKDSIEQNKTKKCFCVYISPETFKRNMDSFSLFNRDGNEKILPMDFITFNHFIEYLIEHDKTYFDIPQLELLFRFQVKTSSTDADVLEYINEKIIKNPEIEAEIKIQRIKEQEKKDREIESNMKKIHNMLRTKYGQNPDEAVKEVSKIIFLKMYEEEKELKALDYENRCTIKRLRDFKKQGQKDPINYLFNLIKGEMKNAEPHALIFDDNEKIELDEKTVNRVLELINGYSFVRMGMDIKGKVYELYLGSTMKNTALGQYFTPEKIIDFMVEIADLKIRDKILDPCCGTGRFLTKAMDSLVERARKSNEFTEDDVSKIKKEQIHGIDLSKAVFKIARMNMYIHGDGKTNIIRGNMITYDPELKGDFTVVLTNPPFGDINIVDDVEDFDEFEEKILKEFPMVERERIQETDKIKAKGYKGGALLLQRMNVMLKKKYGKLLTVIDEGALNTEEYKEVRAFIRKNFFIKAIISLPQTTFKKLAKSMPKASIIYLLRKDNELDRQEEPCFFAQASQVGIDTRGRPCRNDFELIIEEFKKFSDEVEKNKEKHNGLFNKKDFGSEKFSGEKNKSWWTYKEDQNLMFYFSYIDEIKDRLDFTYNRPDYEMEIEKIRKEKHTEIKTLLYDNLVIKGLTPDKEKDKKKEIPLLTIKNIQWNGSINYNDLAYVSRNYFMKRKEQMGLEKGDIIIAITGATIGKTAIFNDDKTVAICGDLAKLKPKDKDHSILLANFLMSELGQLQIKKAINGSTNFHLSPTDIETIIMPEFDDEESIKCIMEDFDMIIERLARIEKLKDDIEKKKRDFIPALFTDSSSLKNYKKLIEELKEKTITFINQK